jgi:hypothetical protein
MRNFHSDLKIGEEAEKEFAKSLLKDEQVSEVFKVDWSTHPYDLEVILKNGQTKTFEVKVLAGGYNTGVVEVWADDAKSKRPHWWSEDTNFVVFKNASTNTWYMYKAKDVIAWLKAYDSPLVRANNGCADDSGWLAKFYWNPDMKVSFKNQDFVMDGFVQEVKIA